MNTTPRFLHALAASLALGLVLPVGRRPATIGPNGAEPPPQYVLPARGLPDAIDPGKYKPGTEEVDMATTKNVKWVARLGTQSYGNVTVAQGRVFVGTNNDNPRDLQHQGDRSILFCFDEKTGEFLWQLIVPKLRSGKVNDWENLGCSPRRRSRASTSTSSPAAAN